VGRLSQRHGIKVQLRHSWYGGVTALTLLPNGMLVFPKVPQMVAAEPAAMPGRAELPPPERASAEPPPDGAGDPTPIFEAARSDWFVAEPPEPPPPHRLHRGPAPDGDGVGRGERAVPRPAEPPPPPPVVPPVPPSGEPAYRPSRVPPPPRPAAEEPAPYRPEPAQAADDQPPLYRAERARRREAPPPPPPATEPPAYQQPPYRQAAGPPPPAAAPPAAPDPAARVTQAGLPRRVPRANLAPGMVATQQAETEPAPGPGSGRSPDEVRSMLSSYRTGIERGRTVAGGSDPGERPPEGP